MDAVALEPQGSLDVRCREYIEEIGVVGRGPGVRLSSGTGELAVEVGNIGRTAEHKVLEEVGHSGVAGVFVARADIIQHIDHRHGLRGVVVEDYTESVFK